MTGTSSRGIGTTGNMTREKLPQQIEEGEFRGHERDLTRDHKATEKE